MSLHTLTLTLPDAKLSPNARVHWATKARITKEHRSRAYWQTLAAIGDGILPATPPVSYSLTFFHKGKRRRDDDNALASTKSYRDGIAQAYQMDDHGLKFCGEVEMLIDRDHPRLEINLEFNTNTKKMNNVTIALEVADIAKNQKIQAIAEKSAANLIQLFAEYEDDIQELLQQETPNLTLSHSITLSLGLDKLTDKLAFAIKHGGSIDCSIPDPAQPSLL